MSDPGAPPPSWHALAVEQVFAELKSSCDGLPSAEAQARLRRHGPNRIERGPRRSALKILLRERADPLVYVLIAAGLMAVSMGKVTDGMVVLAVVVISTLVGFVQEMPASKAIEALSQLMPQQATVARDGDATAVPAHEVVPGDALLPPRDGAIEAVHACQRASVVVKMVTSDHPATARAIGALFGLFAGEGGGAQVVTGRQIEATSDDDLIALARATHVFARVAPEHKLRLVKALQADGQIVAMTGDGVNDAPALKRAEIGVAMGISGTAVAREAADMVLADDNFASISAAVEEGRRVYDNLLKSLAFILPTSLGQAMIILVAVLFTLAALLFVFAVPNVLPVPPGTSAVLGAPLVILAAQPAFERRPWLPAVIAHRTMTRSDFSALVRRIGPRLARAQRLLGPTSRCLDRPQPRTELPCMKG